MPELLQTLHEQYRTECYGSWHTRECYPWEYDAKIEECIKLANSTDWYHQKREDSSRLFFLTQAKILQDRASHIRHEWAKQEAIKQAAIQSAKQAATQQTVTSTPLAVKLSTPPPQSDPPAAVTQQQPSPAKKRRNQKTRQQYKRKKALHVTVQPLVKEMEHTKQTKPREHIVSERIKLVAWDWSTTSWCWYAVIPWNEMTMVLLRCEASEMPRIGIG